jgi:hypothetical protein
MCGRYFGVCKTSRRGNKIVVASVKIYEMECAVSVAGGLMLRPIVNTCEYNLRAGNTALVLILNRAHNVTERRLGRRPWRRQGDDKQNQNCFG